jgi:hypothetical protein
MPLHESHTIDDEINVSEGEFHSPALKVNEFSVWGSSPLFTFPMAFTYHGKIGSLVAKPPFSSVLTSPHLIFVLQCLSWSQLVRLLSPTISSRRTLRHADYPVISL